MSIVSRVKTSPPAVIYLVRLFPGGRSTGRSIRVESKQVIDMHRFFPNNFSQFASSLTHE